MLPVLLCWSGGKDAAWALHVLRQHHHMRVVALLSTLDEDDGRATMQGVRENVLQAQADAAGLPLLHARLPRACDNATYLQYLAQSLAAARLRWPALRTLAFGDLLLEDIRQWRQRQFAGLGWDCHFPLFGSDTSKLARQMIDAGMRAHLCRVDTQVLDASFAGRAFDHAVLDDLPAGIDPCGENGEFHTCVSAGPMFATPLSLHRGETVPCDRHYACTDFMPA